MNLINHYHKRTLETLIKKYYAGQYKDLGEFRALLMRDYASEYVRVRDVQMGKKFKMNSWEVKALGKIYFFDYEPLAKRLQFVGVR